MMSLLHRCVLFIVLFLTQFAWGQATEEYIGEYADFYRAEELFEKEQYSAAEKTFDLFLSSFQNEQDPQYIKARYYKGLSALYLYNRNAVNLLMEFIHDYPESIYKNGIYFKIGNHYYHRKKYEDADLWFKKVDHYQLDTTQLASYYFKVGYSNFQLGNFSEARNNFYEIKDGNSNYSQPALYYYSYISYNNKAYQEALEGFLKLEENSVFKKEVAQYIIQLYYFLGNYEKVTELGPTYTHEAGGLDKNAAEMNLVIGESFYKTQKYDEAVSYLEDHYEREETTREEQYALAYSYFKSIRYDKAIRLFNQVAQTNDKLGQTALYHIAQSYLGKEELNYAKTAFKAASNFDFNKQIQEDALYNYAVLAYQLDNNPYNNAIQAFELFLEQFPDSKRKENVYNYLVNVYSSTKNYEMALQSLNRIPHLNIKLKTAYQVASFNLGVENYKRGNYAQSIRLLKDVQKHNIDPTLTGKAKFWIADVYYMQKEWNNALASYRDFLGIPGINDIAMRQDAYYNIAYCYYNQKDWTQAIQSFRTYSQLNAIQNLHKLGDAYARIGDCYYIKQDPDFKLSSEYYKRSLDYEGIRKDYILFSLAKVYKIIPGKREKQIATLKTIINEYPTSPYITQSIFEIGEGYKYIENFEQSITYFNKIIHEYPSNILVKEALIEIGDIKFKKQKYEAAESYFRRVLDEYALNDEQCKSVTQRIVDIYRATKQQNKIIALGNEYACAGISEDDEEIYFYESAAKLYVNEKYEQSIPEIHKYLNKYPKGKYASQLMSYLATIYYDNKQIDSAIIYYKNIIELPVSPYSIVALVRISKTLYNNGEYEEALPYYKQLENLASDPQLLFNTRIGLMRTNYLIGNFDEAIPAAKKVLGDNLLSNDTIKIEGNYIAGMSYFNINKDALAIPYLRWTADNTSRVRGTEALYTLTYCYFNRGNFKKAEELHQELLNRKPSYDYWIAKSLLLQSKVFIEKDDLFQAEQTASVVLNNYPYDNDDIKSTAKKILAKITELRKSPRTEEKDSVRTIDINEANDE